MKPYKVLGGRLDKAQKRIRELGKVIKRIGEITSEEWGESDTIYEEELNHLIMKRTAKKFYYDKRSKSY